MTATVALCKKCASLNLLLRTDLDTLEKFRRELCPLCKARVDMRSVNGALRYPESKRAAKLIRKYGI